MTELSFQTPPCQVSGKHLKWKDLLEWCLPIRTDAWTSYRFCNRLYRVREQTERLPKQPGGLRLPLTKSRSSGVRFQAIVATVGVNPSPGEFEGGRPTVPLPTPAHLGRLITYFSNPAIPPHPWFDPWEDALNLIGRSYRTDAVHLDISPRATEPMSTCADQLLFGQMLHADVAWFFQLLLGLPRLRGLLIAGSLFCLNAQGGLRRPHIDSFLKSVAPTHGFDLSRVRWLNRDRPPTKIYSLMWPDGRSVPVFFCGQSPSGNSPQQLVERVRQHSPLLKRLGF